MSEENIPYTLTPRPDTGIHNAKLGMWLFTAAELMFFGALFSSYVLLRIGAGESWPKGSEYLSLPLEVTGFLCLALALFTFKKGKQLFESNSLILSKKLFRTTSLAGFLFVLLRTTEFYLYLSKGYLPKENTFLAIYYLLNGLHALHMLGTLFFLETILRENFVIEELTLKKLWIKIDSFGLYWQFLCLLGILIGFVFYWM